MTGDRTWGATGILACRALGAGLVMWVAGGFAAVNAGPIAEQVQFPATEIQPTKFKIKRAAAKGIVLAAKPGITLVGTLYSPQDRSQSDRPHPAVVLLLSGDGLQQSHIDWAWLLTDWGYGVLLVDSFAARGGQSFRDTPAIDLPDDAYSAVRYLTTRNDIRADRIAMLGFSLGGTALFTVVSPDESRRPEGFDPVAAVAVYPTCPPEGRIAAPMLVVAGDKDKFVSSAACASFAKDQTGPEFDLLMLPGATHFFDNPVYDTSGAANASRPVGFEDSQYDAVAHNVLKAKLQAFLARHLK